MQVVHSTDQGEAEIETEENLLQWSKWKNKNRKIRITEEDQTQLGMLVQAYHSNLIMTYTTRP